MRARANTHTHTHTHEPVDVNKPRPQEDPVRTRVTLWQTLFQSPVGQDKLPRKLPLVTRASEVERL